MRTPPSIILACLDIFERQPDILRAGEARVALEELGRRVREPDDRLEDIAHMSGALYHFTEGTLSRAYERVSTGRSHRWSRRRAAGVSTAVLSNTWGGAEGYDPAALEELVGLAEAVR